MEIIKESKGFLCTVGKTAGKYKNPYKIWNNGSVEMFDENKDSFFFDHSDLELVTSYKTSVGNPVSWFVANTGKTCDGKRTLNYVASRDNQKTIYLHALIMDNIGNENGKSVDHIDRNPLNNRRHNLRLATQTEQNENTGKRSRKKNAKPLPDGIEHSDLPKYVVYYNENVGPDKIRDFFRIEKHPLQNLGHFKNKWATTKSMDIKKATIQTKLQQAKNKLEELDKQLEVLNENNTKK